MGNRMKLISITSFLTALSVAACMTENNPDSCVHTACPGGSYCNAPTGRCVSILTDGGSDSADQRVGDSRETGDLPPPTETNPSDPTGSPEMNVPIGTVTIEMPSATTYTNASVDFVLTVTGPPPTSVELVVDDQKVASLTPPYRFSWDTRMVAEGNHNVIARSFLGSQMAMSQILKVIVDRTAPLVTRRAPIADASSVPLTDPIQLTFSESVSPSTIRDGTIALAVGSTPIPTTTQLSADGKILSVQLKNPRELMLPAKVAASIATTITDLAGNPLAPTTWSWTYPLWMKLDTIPDTASGSVKVVADAKGGILVAWETYPSTNESVAVARNAPGSGTGWDQSYPKLMSPGRQPQMYSYFINSLSLAVDAQGNPVVAWSEDDSYAYASLWLTDRWFAYPRVDADGKFSTKVSSVSLALQKDGVPWLAWSEDTNGVRLAKLNQGSWDLGPGTPAMGFGSTLAMTQSGDPVVGWSTGSGPMMAGVSRWNSGSGWTTGPQWGGQLSSMYLDMNDRPVIASLSGTSIQVQRLEGNQWVSHASAITVSPGSRSALLVLDPAGQPIVAWQDANVLKIGRWSSNKWDFSFGDVTGVPTGATIDYLDLAVTKDGYPILAWTQWSGSGYGVFVWRSNR